MHTEVEVRIPVRGVVHRVHLDGIVEWNGLVRISDLLNVKHRLDTAKFDYTGVNSREAAVTKKGVAKTTFQPYIDLLETACSRPKSLSADSRGMVIMVNDIVDHKEGTFSLIFSRPENSGFGDGNNSIRQIEERVKADQRPLDAEFTVSFLVDVPVERVPQLRSAKNAAVPQTAWTIDNSFGIYNTIKETLKKYPYSEDIQYKQNSKGNINITEILQPIFCFCPREIVNYQSIYGQKGKLGTQYRAVVSALDGPDKAVLAATVDFLPEILQLRDHILLSLSEMPEYVTATNNVDRGCGPLRYLVTKRERLHRHAPIMIKGYIIPMFHAFHLNVGYKGGACYWKVDPYHLVTKEFLRKMIDPIVKMRTRFNTPDTIGKSTELNRDLNNIVEGAVTRFLRKPARVISSK